ncbi:DnaJ-like protein subfamily C member 2 [Pancytospora philotis]|nr:DnaJ-like protein subfamily C member 2 [Pancytospora philotis]
MSFEIITINDLTDADRTRCRVFIQERNLYNKYTEEELRDWTKIDLYEAFDLDALRYEPIPSDVLKHVYKKKLVLYHPQRNRDRESAFLLVKQALTIFSNPKYRKLYDSVFLDESIPAEREYSVDEFLREFAPVFERNGSFSEQQPVPRLGDGVDAFYKFWFNFKSTRVFDDPAEVFGQNGSARRYYADKNKDAITKRKHADARRIDTLVKLAYKCDPRIKKAPSTKASWNEAELKSLQKFGVLLGKHKDKYAEIAKKLNFLYLTKRSPQEVKAKLEGLKK